jgi:predicted glycogen debranching enzyme
MGTDSACEWLEADGLGGFASGTENLIRTRRYHGLLLSAVTPPTGRVMLVNGFEAWLETPRGRVDLTSQCYAGGVTHPEGHRHITHFSRDPWPTWTYDAGVCALTLEIASLKSRAATVVCWTAVGDVDGVTLCVRPLLSGRDYHALQRENTAINLGTRQQGSRLSWHTYPDQPVIYSVTNGTWEQSPAWYRSFQYSLERERGLDDVEDLASPGILRFRLGHGTALWMMGTRDVPELAEVADVLDDERRRRAAFASPLLLAADAYLVARGAGRTIVAGYPWFTDWGRDTFIAMRGLCLSTGRYDAARDILLEWAPAISRGMLPNRFPDSGDTAEYNSIDASLWFVVATGELLAAASANAGILTPFDRHRLESATVDVLEGLAAGTRYGIHCDGDGLLACGEPGVQLTWMDAKVGDRVITPRVGKPVEIQALWIHALRLGAQISHRWRRTLERAERSFALKFWNAEAGCLYDVVDVDHMAGRVDASIRPNQVFAVGGLGSSLVLGERARSVVDVLERHLLTPLGLRTLSPASPDYVGHYEGGPAARDAAYHQGTAWPWLMASFVDAWLNARGNSAAALHEARMRFLPAFDAHLTAAGLGHVSEIVDADPPFTPRGCPFQAWSLGELIRLQQRLTYT